MSYAIAHIVFGIPLVDIGDEILENMCEEGTDGFGTFYTAGGPAAGYFGVEMTTFDEASGHIEASDLVDWFTPTQAHKEECRRLWDELDSDLQNRLDLHGPLRPVVIWGSS